MDFIRDSRLTAPPIPTAAVEIRHPPEPPAGEPGNPLARLLPVLMLVAVGGMVVLYLTSGQSTTRNPMFMIFPVMMLVSVLGTLAHTTRGKTAELNAGRREYLRYLDTVSTITAGTAEAQHHCLHWTHPDPAVLWTLAGGRRMWERRPADPDFRRIRVGLGAAPLSTPLTAPPADSAVETDPVTGEALDGVLRSRALVADIPVTVDVTGHIGVPSPALARAMVCQLAVLHSPRDLRIAAVVAPGKHCWDWLKWLPHHTDPSTAAHTVLICDGGAVAATDTVSVLDVGGTDESVIDSTATVVDGLSEVQALMCARRLARWRPGTDAACAGLRSWPELMSIEDPGTLDPVTAWHPHGDRERLRVPIGIGEGDDNHGEPITLDIKESAQHGMGPHGLCVGATGSGKSEFLRTLILGLVATHPPEELNLALVDFKGGATFLGFERLRHVAAVITNLADETYLVSRMADALSGEMDRRQQMLRRAGNLANIGAYRQARAAGADLPALPVLFIVVDEFSELLSQHPDFAELFVAIGRLGRSLGMHLLLASQRLDEGRLRGLETHLSYRVCLKTFSTSESRAVLGVPDAYQLPAEPGAAYLKTASGDVVRFRAAFVSGPGPAPVPIAGPAPVARLFPAAVGELPAERVHEASPATVLGTVLDRLAGHGDPAHQVWLPPLRRSPTLDDLLAADQRRTLTAPIGLVDNPFAQRHDRLHVDLNGADGNVAVVGTTRSGKSTTVCTLLLALAATHSPDEMQFYCLDFGGGALAAVQSLPHTGVVAGRGDGELARRTVAHLHTVIRRRLAGDDDQAAVILVVDGWATLRQECEGLEEAVTALAAQGLSHGVHVIVTAARWSEIRPALKDQLGTRIELKLGDPAESEMDRKAARHLADAPPGTGVTRDGRISMIARPQLHGLDVAAAARELRSRHRGRIAAPVGLLPVSVPWDALTATLSGAGSPTRVVIGIGEAELRPVAVDFGAVSHLIMLGDSGCGKTAVLRTLCREVMRTCSPEAARLHLVDPRRTLLEVVETEHLGGYAMSTTMLATQLPDLTALLRARLPGETVTQQQLRDRSWWVGPEIFVLVDDYDLLAGPNGDPLTPLLEFLPHARDIGLHLVIARRAGGAARALFNPVLATMRELGSSGLLMSAGPDEGTLLGAVRPSPLPAGRATLITRGSPDERVQIAWTEPP